VARDPARAASLFLEAAAAGDPDAQHNVSMMYYHGTGVPKDLSAAAMWSARSAAHGNSGEEIQLAEKISAPPVTGDPAATRPRTRPALRSPRHAQSHINQRREVI
jgi:hypothetical protein